MSVSMLALLSIGNAENLKEQNEVSGSKGEANFVWRCKSCKVNNYLDEAYFSFADELLERGNSDDQKSASSIHTCLSAQEAEHR